MTHAALNHRRSPQPVRRDSFDVDDPRAQVFRPFEHGLTAVEKYLQVFDDYRNTIKRKGEVHRLNANCRAVLETILRRCLNFRNGTCEPSLETLARFTRLAKPTVVECLRRLNAAGFISWIRRTERTGLLPGEGPQVRQVTNAYFFDFQRLPERALKWLREKLRRKGKVFDPPKYAGVYLSHRQRRVLSRNQLRAEKAQSWQDASPEAQARHLYPGDPASQAEHLEMLAQAAQRKSASSASVLNPPSTIQRE